MVSQFKIRILNGPNLNLLGMREPEIYGHDTLDDIHKRCLDIGGRYGVDIDFFQSNHEGEIVDWIQGAIGHIDGIIINAAAYTHTSIAIHDALRAYDGKTIELHISNPHLRESFRHISYIAIAVDSVIAGLGVAGYELAVKTLSEALTNPPQAPSP